MNDLIINVEKSTRMVLMTKTTVGNDMENLQEKIIFKFTDTFVDGQARLEYKIGSTKNYIELTKENNTYILPIQNVLAKEGKIEMQLVITQGTQDEHIPVFKSNVFYLYCNRSLNAVSESPEGYDLWIEQANAKLNAMDEALEEVDNLDIDASKSGDTATISITNKEGTTKTVQVKDGIDGQQGETGPANTLSIGTVTKGENASATITGESPNQTLNLVLPKGDKGDKGNTGATGNDGYSPSASVTQLSGGATITITDKTGTTTATITSGEQGPEGPAGKDGTDGADGKDAKINGVNALNIAAGTNISLDQQGSTLTINATGGSGGTSDYSDLTNKPSINSITLSGNKTSSDLGVQPSTDNNLTTTNKTVTSAINEVNSIAKGANQAVGYNNYSDMITALNAMDDEEYNVGQNVYIVTVNVPDLWVSSVESTSSTYTYVDDATVVNDLETNGYIQVGYYKLSMLETQKVDLTNYITNTDYAGSNKSGVIRTNPDYGTSITSVGALISATKTYQQYQDTTTNNMFISKGTLENVITGKGLVSNTDYGSFATAGVIKASSTYGTQFASTGAMYAQTKTYEQYTDSTSPGLFIGKGTLENIITGKGLVTNTDYATSSTGGVIRTGASYGTTMASAGTLRSVVKTYEDYSSAGSYMFISKGTLENVFNGKGLLPIVTLTQQEYDALATKDPDTYYYIEES